MPGRRQGRGAAEPEPPWNGRGEEPTRRPRGFQKAVRTGAGTAAACHAAPTPPPTTRLRRPSPDWLTDMLPPAPGHDVRARSPGEGRGWQPRVSQRGAGPPPWRGGARRAERGPRRPRCPAPLCRASGLTSWPGHPASRGGRLVPVACCLVESLLASPLVNRSWLATRARGVSSEQSNASPGRTAFFPCSMRRASWRPPGSGAGG